MEMDLRAAARRGLLPWAVDGLGGVELDGLLLRFDPALSWKERGKLVLAVLRTIPSAELPASKKYFAPLP